MADMPDEAIRMLLDVSPVNQEPWYTIFILFCLTFLSEATAAPPQNVFPTQLSREFSPYVSWSRLHTYEFKEAREWHTAHSPGKGLKVHLSHLASRIYSCTQAEKESNRTKLQVYLQPFPLGDDMAFRLTTARLILEDLKEDDLENIRRIATDPEVMRYVLIWLEDDDQIARFLQRGIDEAKKNVRTSFFLSARVLETGEFAGLTFLEIDPELPTTGEVGIVLLPNYQASGYGKEILMKFMEFGFETLSLHRVFGKCDALNSASARLMEQCGMTYEGTIREHVWLRDHWRSTRYYGMLAGEYAARRE